MPLEAGFWVLLALTAPLAAPRIGRWLETRISRAAEPLRELAPWLYGLLPGYLAWFTGAVAGRDAGLYGHSLGNWLYGSVLVAALLTLAGLARLRWAVAVPAPQPVEGALDEFRWALYRAAGRLWLGPVWAAALLGAALALVETALRRRAWQQLPPFWPEAAVVLIRVAVSSLVFAFTSNLWLSIAAHVGLLGLARWRPSPAAGDPA